MTARFVSLLIVGMLLAGLAFTAESQAQQGKKKGDQAQKQQMNLNEAEVLREAYLLLAAANHDYKGHRAKAMEHVHAAYQRLDHKVLRKGTDRQKAVTEIEDTATARAAVVAK